MPKPNIQVSKDFIAQAEVRAVDQERRLITVRRPDGLMVTLKAHPAVHNFDQIKEGDVLELDVHQSIVLTISASDDLESEIDVVAVQSAEGEDPAIGIAEVLNLKAKVTAIDYETRMVTLEGKHGNSRTLKISRSAENFEAVKVGDVIHAKITLAIAVMARHSDTK